MKTGILVVLMLLMLTMIYVSDRSYAAVGDVTVTIGGICILGPLPPPLPISGPCPLTNPLITISDKPGTSGARVAMVDGGSDILILSNAVITANQAVSDFHIVAEREFVPGPKTDPTPTNVFYKTTAQGTFNVGTNNWAAVSGFVNHLNDPLNNTWSGYIQMGTQQTCQAPCSGNPFSLSTSGQWPRPPELVNNRQLKFDFSFALAQNNTLTLASNAGMIKNITAGEVGGELVPCPPCVVYPGLWWLITIVGLLVLILLVLLWCCRARKLPVGH